MDAHTYTGADARGPAGLGFSVYGLLFRVYTYTGADACGTAGVAEYYRMPGYGLTLPLAFRKHQRRSLEPLLLRPVLQ